jgi:predicted nuclease of predicted toxin-antitoxin system
MTVPDPKFLVDVGVETKVENYLREEGYDLKTVRAINPRLPDEAIVQLAIADSRMIVTMDKDFGELVYRWRRPHAGVLLLRMEEATGHGKAEAVAHHLRIAAPVSKRPWLTPRRPPS